MVEVLGIPIGASPATQMEALKASLEAKVSDYRGLVYTPETIKRAKKDLAELRKIESEIDDKRKELERECLRPYQEAKPIFDELLRIVREPIGQIDSQWKEAEKERKARKRAEIMEYMGGALHTPGTIPAAVCDKAASYFYDPRWENATTKDKTWRESIDGIAARLSEECIYIWESLSGYEFLQSKVLDEYSSSGFSIASAMRVISEAKEVYAHKSTEKEETLPEELPEESPQEEVQDDLDFMISDDGELYRPGFPREVIVTVRDSAELKALEDALAELMMSWRLA